MVPRGVSSSDWRETERLARKSLALDSSYQSARLTLSLALLNLGKLGEADSNLRIVESDESGLSQAEGANTERQRGAIEGDQAKRYRGAKRLAEVAPSMLALDAQHQMGRHTLELESAREVRVHYPANLCTLYYEAIALAALKRTTEAE